MSFGKLFQSIGAATPKARSPHDISLVLIGEVFVKLADRDDQGWCKGRVNGRVGLYPDNYVQVINP